MSSGLQNLRSAFLAAERALTRIAVATGCVGLVVASLAGLYQVLARFVFHAPASWSEPLIQLVLIWMTYLALAGAMRTGTLISVDVLRSYARGPFKRILDLYIVLATMGLLLVLFWFGWELAIRVQFQTIAGLGIPATYAYASLPVGAAISMIALVAHAMDPGAQADVAADAKG
jgi:TRAP-type C4-dicarboxylate transport system permease small subunit